MNKQLIKVKVQWIRRRLTPQVYPYALRSYCDSINFMQYARQQVSLRLCFVAIGTETSQNMPIAIFIAGLYKGSWVMTINGQRQSRDIKPLVCDHTSCFEMTVHPARGLNARIRLAINIHHCQTLKDRSRQHYPYETYT